MLDDRQIRLSTISKRSLKDIVGSIRCSVLDANKLPAISAKAVKEAPSECAITLTLFRMASIALDRRCPPALYIGDLVFPSFCAHTNLTSSNSMLGRWQCP